MQESVTIVDIGGTQPEGLQTLVTEEVPWYQTRDLGVRDLGVSKGFIPAAGLSTQTHPIHRGNRHAAKTKKHLTTPLPTGHSASPHNTARHPWLISTMIASVSCNAFIKKIKTPGKLKIQVK